MDTLLVIEDEALIGSEIKRHFQRSAWHVVLAPTIREAEHLLLHSRIAPLVVLSDMNLPDGNGLDLIGRTRGNGDTAEWVFLTGYGEPADAERAQQLGAVDFLQKPVDFKNLDLVIAGAARSARAQRRLKDHATAERLRFSLEAFVGSSPAARRVRELMRRLVDLPISSIMIAGETGTGKGLVARILHYSGQRSDGPFVEVNCAALPKDLLESELFGHEHGAFTGAKGPHRGLMEQADGGSLFLDEISEMDAGLQAKLLTAIESRRMRRLGGEREISTDIQVFAASNRDLADAVSEGCFRADLYHRLSVFELRLPALRDRREDVEELVAILLHEFNIKAKKHVNPVPPAIVERLKAYDWPGNVRQLRNVIERCILLSDGDTFPEEWLQLGPSPGAATPRAHLVMPEGDWIHLPIDGSMALDDMDRHIIKTALERHGHNVMATARALGTTRETLRYRIQKYSLIKS
jgi:two-component system response regulator AtoC